MHFCVSAARVGEPGTAPGHLSTSGARWPRKIGTNWFMPALVNSRFGASGSNELDGTMVCCFSRKKSRKLWRISAEVITLSIYRICHSERSEESQTLRENDRDRCATSKPV